MQFPENNTLFIGKNLITLKKVDSTNNYAKLLLANSGPVPSGTVILADEQSGGRGQGNARWLSEPEKNLTFSLILHNDFLSPADQFYLNMAVSLGVVEGLSALLPTPQVSSPSSPMKSPERDLGRIKWPNDIFFGQRKLGGILIENMLAGAILKTSVVGIGLNVNQEQFRGLKQATSLKLETGRDFLLKPLLAGIFHSLEARYLQLRGGAREQLRKAYLDQLLGYDRPRLFRLVQGPAKHREAGILSDIPDAFEGVIRGVSPEGRLLVETNGCIQSFDKKEIEFLF